MEEGASKFDVISAQIKPGEKWNDPDFPPNLESLMGDTNDKTALQGMKAIRWRRPDEYLSQGTAVVFD